jgi:hypothetical protein
VYLCLSAANHTGSAEALELAHRPSSWHDDMVIHARALARGRSTAECDESCPHGRAIELWRAAREVLGDAAHQLGFLKIAAASARSNRHSALVTGDVEESDGASGMEPSRAAAA